jgi:hypothetical protein
MRGKEGKERGELGRAWMGRVERRGERGEGSGLLLSFPFPFLFFFLSTLKLFKQFYLNSNKFEFKPYIINTNKTMLQHECINKLIL